MKIKIQCTKEHLKQSMYCGTDKMKGYVTSNCWIAKACQDIFPRCNVQRTFISNSPHLYDSIFNIEIPTLAVRAIDKFDELKSTPEKRLELEPFEFEVEIIDEQLEKINDHYGYSINSLVDIIEKTDHLELV